jgi:hypothetical protein
VEESCDAERGLHAALFANPREAVGADRLARLADADARDNYRVLLGFIDRLVRAGSVEDCYLGLFLEERVPVPALFIDQLAQVLVRHLLTEAAEPLAARTGEILFRPQKVAIEDGAILLADLDTIEMHATTGGFGDLGRLIVQAETPVRTVDLDILTTGYGDVYWERDERYDTVLDLSFGRPALDHLCRLLEAWIGHFLGVGVSIQPVQRIADERWVWHIGLDVEASRIMNDLYNGAEVDEERLAQVLSLFRLEFKDPSLVLPRVAGRPVYLGLARAADGSLRLKPQNLLINLPLKAQG